VKSSFMRGPYLWSKSLIEVRPVLLAKTPSVFVVVVNFVSLSKLVRN